jgi:predicted DCC family thiol-disulfide oxidoreductase YuxK
VSQLAAAPLFPSIPASRDMKDCSTLRLDPKSRIIVFDGICHLCSGWIRFLGRHRIDPPFQLIPMQTAAGKELLLEYGIDPEDPATFLVLDQGLRFTESDATIHVITALGGVWQLAGVARVVPRRWRDVIYRLLARNRYRWFGRRSTCYLPN